MSAESGGIRLELLGLTRRGWGLREAQVWPVQRFWVSGGGLGSALSCVWVPGALRSGAWSEGHPSCDQLLGPAWDRRGQPDPKDPRPGGEEQRGPRARSAA